MRCAGCGTENGADRRFCGGCGATLGWACPGCGFANDGTARFCGGCGRPTAAPPEAAPAPEGELREVTVLFADLVGYTALSHELEAEEVHALLNRFFEAVDGVVERHGGSIDKHIGDCVMALFGAPVAHGNDAERAVRAGVAIHAALAVLDGPRRLAAHVGIASGRVVASDTGSRRRQDYTVTGDSVNLAARLTELAGAGETLVSADVYEAVAPLVEAGPAGELSVKGLPGPVRAWRVLAMGGRQARQARFVGRGAELAALAALLAECKASARGRAVHIRGEAGLGKSRLTEELPLHAAGLGFACHRTLVLDFGSGTTDPVRALVRSLLEAGHSAAADLSRVADRAVAEGLVEPAHAPPLYDMLELPLPLAGRSTYDAMSPATRAAALRALLAALVERSAARRPLLLTIEDAHWADPVTLAYLSDLAAACARSAALLVVTARPEGDALLAAWRAESRPLTVDLAPLPEEAAQQLAGSLLTGRRDVAAACVRRAEGNPLFLEQLLRAAEAGAGDLPGSLRSIVLARMDRLGRRDRQALRAAAVLGQRFTLAQLRHLMDDPAYGAEPLLQHQLIRADGEGFLFGHALIREGAYDSLLRASRRALPTARRPAGSPAATQCCRPSISTAPPTRGPPRPTSRRPAGRSELSPGASPAARRARAGPGAGACRPLCVDPAAGRAARRSRGDASLDRRL
ncbi:MAG: adenylate/guanylate cyclase domain-containing protein [Dongiaceae bacterium]